MRERRLRLDRRHSILKVLKAVGCLLCWRAGDLFDHETTTCKVPGRWQMYASYTKATAPPSVQPREVKGTIKYQLSHGKWKEHVWPKSNHTYCWRCILDRDDPQLHDADGNDKTTCKYQGIISVVAWIVRHDHNLRAMLSEDIGLPKLTNTDEYEKWLAQLDGGDRKTVVASTHLVTWFYVKHHAACNYPAL